MHVLKRVWCRGSWFLRWGSTVSETRVWDWRLRETARISCAPTVMHISVMPAAAITGDSTPSKCYIRLTRSLGEGARILQINMLDQ